MYVNDGCFPLNRNNYEGRRKELKPIDNSVTWSFVGKEFVFRDQNFAQSAIKD